MFKYKEIPMSSLWLGNLADFYNWCESRKRELRPRGICGQSMSTVNGDIAFQNEYPTFEDAYKEYKKQFEDWG